MYLVYQTSHQYRDILIKPATLSQSSIFSINNAYAMCKTIILPSTYAHFLLCVYLFNNISCIAIQHICFCTAFKYLTTNCNLFSFSCMCLNVLHFDWDVCRQNLPSYHINWSKMVATILSILFQQFGKWFLFFVYFIFYFFFFSL